MRIFLIAVGIFALVIALIAGMSLYAGWALSILWDWFVMPLGVPDISVLHAMGIMTTVNVLVGSYVFVNKIDLIPLHSDLTKKERVKKTWVQVGTISSTPILSVGIGWIYHHFM